MLAVAYACTGIYYYSLQVEQLYSTMHSQSSHPDTTPVVPNVRILANCQNQQNRGLSGNSQLLPAMNCVSVPLGERDASHGGSSIPSTIQGQNFTPSSSLKNSCIADINQRVTSTPARKQGGSIDTPTSTPGTSSRRTPPPGGTLTCCVLSSPASGIVITPTLIRGLQNLPTPCLIQKPALSIQIHSECKQLNRIRD